MPLYNCFSNNMPTKLDIKVNDIKFLTNDSAYKIFMIPVKFNHKYSIALESKLPVEIVKLDKIILWTAMKDEIAKLRKEVDKYVVEGRLPGSGIGFKAIWNKE